MRLGGDYSWARPDPWALAGAGWTFAVRYLSSDLRTSGGRTKLLDRAEAEALSHAGLDIVLAWEGRAVDRDPLKGYAQGTVDADTALDQAAACGAPPHPVVYYAVDWDIRDPDGRVPEARLAVIGDYFAGVADVHGGHGNVGVYGGYDAVRHLMATGAVGYGWQTYGWSGGRWHGPAQLRQVLNGQTVDGSTVDLDVATAERFGQWRLPVTYAPDDLKAVQAYCQRQTGQPWASLGIVHSTPQGGGYHEGQDLLAAAGRAPGPDYPDSDYSYADARTVAPTPYGRDLATAATLAGDANAASAFDLGGAFPRFLELNNWLVGRCNAGDPRCRDIREVIYTPDGKVVRRWDATGQQDNAGDSSHLSHTHISFFRDSLGRRAGGGNFLGLLVEFFEGADVMATLAEDPDGKWMFPRVEAVARLQKPSSGPEQGQVLPFVAWTGDVTRKLDQLLAKPAGTFTDAQVTALADQIGDAIVAQPDNPLGDADKPAIVAAVKQALGEGVGSGA